MSIKGRIGIGLLVILFVVVFAALKMQRYHVRDTYGIELYWNSNEAYLFVRQTRLGVDLSPAEVIKAYIRESLGSPVSVDQKRQLLTVVWFTKDVADTQTFEDMAALASFRIVNGTLFLDSKRKWKGARLDPATPEEQQMWGATPRSPVLNIRILRDGPIGVA